MALENVVDPLRLARLGQTVDRACEIAVDALIGGSGAKRDLRGVGRLLEIAALIFQLRHHLGRPRAVGAREHQRTQFRERVSHVSAAVGVYALIPDFSVADGILHARSEKRRDYEQQ